MKNILVAISSNDHTDNCMAYAQYLSRATGAHLWVLYVYRPLPPYAWLPKESYEAVSLLHITEAEQKLNAISTWLKQLNHPLFTCLFTKSSLPEELTNITRQQPVELLVLNKAEMNVLLEGIELDTAVRQILFPLLLIPKQASFHPVQDFVFIADFPENFPISPFSLQHFKSCIILATACKAFLHILYQQATTDKLRYLEEQLQEHRLQVEQNYRFVNYSLAGETIPMLTDLPMLVNQQPYLLIINHYSASSWSTTLPFTSMLRYNKSSWQSGTLPEDAPLLILS